MIQAARSRPWLVDNTDSAGSVLVSPALERSTTRAGRSIGAPFAGCVVAALAVAEMCGYAWEGIALSGHPDLTIRDGHLIFREVKDEIECLGIKLFRYATSLAH